MAFQAGSVGSEEATEAHLCICVHHRFLLPFPEVNGNTSVFTVLHL